MTKSVEEIAGLKQFVWGAGWLLYTAKARLTESANRLLVLFLLVALAGAAHAQETAVRRETLAVKLGVPPLKEVPATIQERAWSSPIWYSPPK